MVKSELEQGIIDALEAVAPEHGMDIVDVELTGATKAPCVRVRIDRADGAGITLDEVTAQSRWVSDVLEVSSPGMARPLRRPSDFARFVGSDVELTTTAVEGRRRFSGSLVEADERTATLELEDGERASFPYGEIKKCTLKPVFDFKGGKGGK